MIAIEKGKTLAPFTSFGIGGPARIFCGAENALELRQAVELAQLQGLPYRILGGGTNLLVSDAGFDGVVIKAQLEGVHWGDNGVQAEAGVELMELVRSAARRGLAGVERLAGIPGTLGGAVRGNAGAYGACIADVVREVLALDTKTMQLVTVPPHRCDFGYRTSAFKESDGLIVVSALLELSPAPADEIEARVQDTLERRLAKNLQAERSVGSFFMNPVVHDAQLVRDFERERQVHCRQGRIPAGWLIERAGLRRRRVGSAVVSDRHANYIINTGGATASDVLELAAAIKEEVAAKTGVTLTEEVAYLGF